jgi:hypothetical protein
MKNLFAKTRRVLKKARAGDLEPLAALLSKYVAEVLMGRIDKSDSSYFRELRGELSQGGMTDAVAMIERAGIGLDEEEYVVHHYVTIRVKCRPLRAKSQIEAVAQSTKDDLWRKELNAGLRRVGLQHIELAEDAGEHSGWMVDVAGDEEDFSLSRNFKEKCGRIEWNW